MCSLLYEYSNREYVRIYVIYRATQAEHVIRMFMAASQEYVNTYSALRTASLCPPPPCPHPLFPPSLHIRFPSLCSTPPPCSHPRLCTRCATAVETEFYMHAAYLPTP